MFRCSSGWSRRGARLAALIIVAVAALPAVNADAKAPARISASVVDGRLHAAVRSAPKTACVVRLVQDKVSARIVKGTTGSRGRLHFSRPVPAAFADGDAQATVRCANGAKDKVTVTLATARGKSGHDIVGIVLNALLYVLLGGSLLVFAALLIQNVVRETRPAEKFMGSLALIAGAIVALGASSAGVGFADFTVDALTGARPAGEGFKYVSAFIPGGMAAVVGWYFLRVVKRDEVIGLRFMYFLGMLTIVAFLEIFAVATSARGVELGVAAIPNASFIAGLILVLLSRFGAGRGRERTAHGKGLAFLEGLFRRRGAPRALAPNEPDAAYRNPFLED